MLKFIKNYVENLKRKKMLIKSELERKKTNFVFRYLLRGYEKQTAGTIDIPAFVYATSDLKKIKRMGKLNEAYDKAKIILKKEFKKNLT